MLRSRDVRQALRCECLPQYLRTKAPPPRLSHEHVGRLHTEPHEEVFCQTNMRKLALFALLLRCVVNSSAHLMHDATLVELDLPSLRPQVGAAVRRRPI